MIIIDKWKVVIKFEKVGQIYGKTMIFTLFFTKQETNRIHSFASLNVLV